MQKRRLGRTEHMSTLIVFGAAAFMRKSQEEADRAMEFVIKKGINQIDVAPEYEVAEQRVGKWMENHRQCFFLGCKTLMRKREEVHEEIHRSLERLRTDHFDLYQLHSVDTENELEIILGYGGAMEEILEARSRGLLKFIGITSHSLSLLTIALRRFNFDTVMFPFNFVFYADREYRSDYDALMKLVKERDAGVLVIKSIAKGNWEKKYHNTPVWQLPYATWYEPFNTPEDIDRSLKFALSQNITAAVSASDIGLMKLMVESAARFTPMNKNLQDELCEDSAHYRPLRFTFSP